MGNSDQSQRWGEGDEGGGQDKLLAQWLGHRFGTCVGLTAYVLALFPIPASCYSTPGKQQVIL